MKLVQAARPSVSLCCMLPLARRDEIFRQGTLGLAVLTTGLFGANIAGPILLGYAPEWQSLVEVLAIGNLCFTAYATAALVMFSSGHRLRLRNNFLTTDDGEDQGSAVPGLHDE